jgi:diguanylate cyclase (GGDEF)-like protein
VKGPRVSIAARLVLLMAALAAVSIGLALSLQDRALRRDLEAAATARLEEAAAGSERLLADSLRGHALHYAAVGRTPELRANLEAGHAATLRYFAETLRESEGAAAIVFAGRHGDRAAASGASEVAAAAQAAFDVGSESPACVRPSGEAGAPMSERFVRCASDAPEPQATLVPARGDVYAVARVPLVTRGRTLGFLLAAARLPETTVEEWSRLTGTTLAFVPRAATSAAPLEREVVRFGAIELRASSSMERERAMLARARANLVGVGCASLVLAVAASALLAQGFLRPILSIRRAAELAGQGELTARLEIERNDELGDVAASFNETLRKLHESRERVRVAQRLAHFADWGLDPRTGRLEGSPEFWSIVDVDPDTPTLHAMLARVHVDDCAALETALQRCGEAGHPFRLEVRTADAPPRTLLVQAQRVDVDEPTRIEASVQDITEQRAVERQIRYLAYHDSLTGLGNRRFFEERLAVALAEARRRDAPLAVLFLDLDRFKGINDSLGHSAGDAILQEAASRLLAELDAVPRVGGRSEPAVARLGGDEFMILLPAPSDAATATAVGHALLRRLSEPVRVDDRALVVTGCIGVAICPDDGDDVEALLRSSDTAMYDAKSRGLNQLQLCTESMTSGAERRLHVEMRLREAIERADLELHYQPRVDAQTSQIVGFEALLRWRDPDLGVVSPADFVPIAEDAGLISALGRFVLHKAASQAKAWRDARLGPAVVSVNLSPRQLQGNFVQIFDEVVAATGVDPRAIELEVTESGVMQDAARAVRMLQALRSRGARIALDDFGTGYSSFSTLRELPIDTFKIDRSFVKPLAHDRDAVALVAALVSMARVLRLRVVAEGVEEEAQQELLQEMGCDELQGFLFFEALPAAQAGALLARRARGKPLRRRS